MEGLHLCSALSKHCLTLCVPKLNFSSHYGDFTFSANSLHIRWISGRVHGYQRLTGAGRNRWWDRLARITITVHNLNAIDISPIKNYMYSDQRVDVKNVLKNYTGTLTCCCQQSGKTSRKLKPSTGKFCRQWLVKCHEIQQEKTEIFRFFSVYVPCFPKFSNVHNFPTTRTILDFDSGKWSYGCVASISGV